MPETNGLANVVEAAIREMVREEVRTAMKAFSTHTNAAEPSSRWATPPAAARALGISDKLVRNLIKQGRVESRLRNSARTPKQAKYLVNIDDVAQATRTQSSENEESARIPSLAERAARIRAKSEGE